MEINLAPTSYRIPNFAELFAKISAQSPGPARARRMMDLEAELRDLRVEEVYNVRTKSWRWVVRLDSDHSIAWDGTRVWERELRREDKLDEVRFPDREAAEAALKKYLDAL